MDAKVVAAEEAAGRAQQDAIRAMLVKLAGNGRYMDRERFEADLEAAAKRARAAPHADQEGNRRRAGRARPDGGNLSRQQRPAGAGQ